MSDKGSLLQIIDLEEDEDSEQSDSNINSSHTPEDSQSENSENDIVNESFVSKEEDNCLRYFLGIGIAEKAVRIWFDTVILPGDLENHLKKQGRKFRNSCSDDQLSILFPGNGTVISENFDISLMYKIIRKTTKVRKPRKDWGETPDDSDIGPADDLERVRICRNLLCHGPQSISNTEFEKKWKELKEIIQRLAKGQLDGEIDSLQNKHLDHSARSSVKRSLAVLTERLRNVEKCIGDHVPKNIREQHEKRIRKWREDDRLFVRVPAYQSVRNKIKSLPYVTVTGGGGSGKSFLIRHIALELAKENFEIIPVSSLNEIIMYGNLKIKQLFIVDDVLGVYGLDMSSFQNLIRETENVLSLLESGSKLLMSCRSVVFNESKRLQSFVTKGKYVINLEDKENELNEEDIKNMLENHCKYKEVNAKYFEDLQLPRRLPMFPLLCQIFSSDKKYQVMGEILFIDPYKSIFLELDRMRELKKTHYAGLVYCIMKDNFVCLQYLDIQCLNDVYKCCRLDNSTPDSELAQAMSILKGSYLMQDTDGIYSFIHDSLFEIIAVHFGRSFQDCLIKHCTSRSIYKLLKFGDGAIIHENRIQIVEVHFPILVERIIRDIKQFYLYEVFSSIGHVSGNELFVAVFCRSLKRLSYDEIIQLLFDVKTCEQLDKRTKTLVLEIQKKWEKMLEAQELSSVDSRYYILNECHRVVNWIIAYNHINLLSGILGIIKEKLKLSKATDCINNIHVSNNILEIVFKNDLKSQSLCLNLACSSSSLAMVEMVSRHVNPECLNHIVQIGENNFWPLLFASWSGSNDIVYCLIKKGADVNLYDVNQNSSLYGSCLYGHYDIVKTLIKHGAKVNMCAANGTSPLSAAALGGDVRIVKLLIEKGADIYLCNKEGLSPICYASHFGKLDVLKYLIDSDSNVTISANCPSTDSDLASNSKTDKGLARIPAYGSALHRAASSGHLNIVEYLVEHGADFNFMNSAFVNPLYSATKNKHLHIIRYLVKHGADVNQGSSGDIFGSPLCCASSKGYRKIVGELIKLGADVNLCDLKGDSPLCYASKFGHVEIVKFLLQIGADINVGASCLSSACKSGHLNIVKFLIDKINVNRVDTMCEPPLHCASGQGHLDIVEYLVEHGADINLMSSANISPIYSATQNEQLQVIRYLVEHGADINLGTSGERNASPMCCASGKGNMELVTELTKLGADVNLCNNYGVSPLCFASQFGHKKIVKFLLQNNADINVGASCLSFACESGHLDVVKFLIDKIDVNKVYNNCYPALTSASCQGHLDIVEYLVEHGADVNLMSSYNVNPLYSATAYGQIHIIRYLVEHGADINQGSSCDMNGSPLCCASSKGYLEIVRELIKLGADVNLCNLKGDSPLCYASRYGHLEIVKFLLHNDADINIGASCLSSACKGGHLNVVKFLIDKMDVNKVNDICDPPLHCASVQGHIEVIEYLVEHGADVNLLSCSKDSPLCCAVENGHFPIVECLVKHGSDINKAVEIAMECGQEVILDYMLKHLN